MNSPFEAFELLWTTPTRNIRVDVAKSYQDLYDRCYCECKTPEIDTIGEGSEFCIWCTFEIKQ